MPNVPRNPDGSPVTETLEEQRTVVADGPVRRKLTWKQGCLTAFGIWIVLGCLSICVALVAAGIRKPGPTPTPQLDPPRGGSGSGQNTNVRTITAAGLRTSVVSNVPLRVEGAEIPGVKITGSVASGPVGGMAADTDPLMIEAASSVDQSGKATMCGWRVFINVSYPPNTPAPTIVNGPKPVKGGIAVDGITSQVAYRSTEQRARSGPGSMTTITEVIAAVNGDPSSIEFELGIKVGDVVYPFTIGGAQLRYKPEPALLGVPGAPLLLDCTQPTIGNLGSGLPGAPSLTPVATLTR